MVGQLAEGSPLAGQVALPDHLVKCPRPHPDGKRRRSECCFLLGRVEQTFILAGLGSGHSLTLSGPLPVSSAPSRAPRSWQTALFRASSTEGMTAVNENADLVRTGPPGIRSPDSAAD